MNESNVDPKQEVLENEEKSPLASRVPEIPDSGLLPSEDCIPDPPALDPDILEHTETERDSELKEEDEDFYNGEIFFGNCSSQITNMFFFRS